MIKRKLCCMLIFSFLLTGCSSVKLSQTESGQVSEYIAYSLLKYNDNPDVLITDTAESEAPAESSEKPSVNNTTEEQASTSKPVSTTSTPSTEAVKTVTAGKIFGSDDFQISIQNKGLYDSYPEDNSSTYFSLSATSGKKLLVLELKIKNTGSKAQAFKTSGSGLSYTLNGDNSQKALVTLLEDDVHFFKTSVKSGKGLSALLLFEVDKNFKADNLKVTVSKAGQSVDIPVK